MVHTRKLVRFRHDKFLLPGLFKRIVGTTGMGKERKPSTDDS
jgi:hypothetical protein